MECINIYDSEINKTHLYQGDIFKRFEVENAPNILPLIRPPEIALMVLNYTCDLISKKDLKTIYYCPVFKFDVVIKETLEGLKKKHPKKGKDNILGMLNNKIASICDYEAKFHFFLPKTSEFGDSEGFADLLNIRTIPVKFDKYILENRIKSLKSPWREKLGWKIGYIFNRIGLPDVTSTKISDFLKNHNLIKSYIEKE